MKRIFRIALGLVLIGYAVYSGNAWFYLGVVPLFFGAVNWCPMEKLFGGCKDSSCGCTPKDDNKTTSCCGGDQKDSDKTSCCS
jgi:hypothetical protein